MRVLGCKLWRKGEEGENGGESKFGRRDRSLF